MSLLLLFQGVPTEVPVFQCWATAATTPTTWGVASTTATVWSTAGAVAEAWSIANTEYLDTWQDWGVYTWAVAGSRTWEYLQGLTFSTATTGSTTWTTVIEGSCGIV